jgi:alpha-tubulin suppressor-like RCC1 family protein
MKLLLIDTRLEDQQIIIDSLQESTKYILLDYENDTFDTLEDKIESLNETNFDSIALMAHGHVEPTYKMLNSQQTESILRSVEYLDPELDSWDEIVGFWNRIAQHYNTTYIDYLGCAILNNPDWNYVIFQKLNNSDLTLVKFRASNNNTGNNNGADWILESDGVNVKELYFTDNILNWPHSLDATISVSSGMTFFNPGLTTLAGEVIAWGGGYWNGGDLTIMKPPFILSGADATISNIAIFLQPNIYRIGPAGGNLQYPLDIRNEVQGITANIKYIASINSQDGARTGQGSGNPFLLRNDPATGAGLGAFAALSTTGRVTAWGMEFFGGNLRFPIDITSEVQSNVISVIGSAGAFAALKDNGNVVVWGNTNIGGNNLIASQFSNIKKLFTNGYSFAGITTNGNIISWGVPTMGGNVNYPVDNSLINNNVKTIIGGYMDRFSVPNISTIDGQTVSNLDIGYSYTAIKADGNIFCWGSPYRGGNINYPNNNTVYLNKPIKKVVDFDGGFGALTLDGNAFTWGFPSFGSSPPIQWTTNLNISGNPIVDIISGRTAIAVLYSNGSARSIASSDGNGGNILFPGVNNGVDINTLNSNIVYITGVNRTFTALRNDGRIFTWGAMGSPGGHFANDADMFYKRGIFGNISGNITQLYTSTFSTLALKNDGNLYVWGTESGQSSGQGGGNLFNPTPVSTSRNLLQNVKVVLPGQNAHVAIKNDNSIAVWGAHTSPTAAVNGNISMGGNINHPNPNDPSNITAVYSTGFSGMSAIKSKPQHIMTDIYTDQEKVEILIGVLNRDKVLDDEANLTIIGTTNINNNMKEGLTYKLINYKNPAQDISPNITTSFYIPTDYGERVIIEGNTYTSYNDRVYRINQQGLYEQVTNTVTINGKRYRLFAGSIGGTEVLDTPTNINIQSSIQSVFITFDTVSSATNYRIYYTLSSGGITNYVDFSSNSGYIYNLLAEEYTFQIAAFVGTNFSDLSSSLDATPISGAIYEETAMKISDIYLNHTNEPGPTSVLIRQHIRKLAQKYNNLANQFNITGLIQDAKNINNLTKQI